MKRNPFDNISLLQLEGLVILVTEGTFSRAAKRMNLSQPSLSKHIRNMEDVLNIPVVKREKSGVTLTPEGKVIYDYARKILKLREETREKIARAHETEAGNIAIAASTIPATYILPHAMSRFSTIHPQIRISLQIADSEEVMEAIINSEREIGIIGKKPQRGKLEAEPLWQDRLILTVPGNHRWADKGPISFREIREEPFLIREKGSATRDILERYLKDKTGTDLSQFHVVAELGSSEAVKEAILAGLGVSILSVHSIRREMGRQLLWEVPVENWRIERPFYLIFRRHTNFLRCHHLFLDFVRHFDLTEHGCS